MVFRLTATRHTPAQTDSIQVSNYKGTTLKAGEGSGLTVSESGCTAVPSDPAIVRAENVLGYWTAKAQAPGKATITVTALDGRTESVTITVEVDGLSSLAGEPSTVLTDNMEIRQELIQLINQVRKENGAPELPVSNALMDAAQTCAGKLYSYHHNQEE